MLKKQLPLIIPILISVAILWLFIFAASRGANQPQKQEQQQQAVVFPDALILPGGTSAKNNSPVFKPSEQVSFTLNLNRKISFKLPFFAIKKALAEEQSKNEWQGDGLKINTKLSHTGNPVDDLAVKIEQKNAEEFALSLEDAKPDTFVPGKYTLDITITTDKGERTITQDFSWGVLAINPQKSIYLSGETAKLGIGVLNETGRTICEAKITLEVTDPEGSKTMLSSENGLVQKSGQCQATSVTNVPDYLAGYKTGNAGVYKMHLSADNGNGIKSLDDAFEVRDSVPFDIERSDYPMRIYPPADYTGTITVKANQDFKGVVEEEVPASFEISNVSKSSVILNASEGSLANASPTSVGMTLKQDH